MHVLKIRYVIVVVHHTTTSNSLSNHSLLHYLLAQLNYTRNRFNVDPHIVSSNPAVDALSFFKIIFQNEKMDSPFLTAYKHKC